jgi:hypothetical protein
MVKAPELLHDVCGMPIMITMRLCRLRMYVGRRKVVATARIKWKMSRLHVHIPHTNLVFCSTSM